MNDPPRQQDREQHLVPLLPDEPVAEGVDRVGEHEPSEEQGQDMTDQPHVG